MEPPKPVMWRDRRRLFRSRQAHPGFAAGAIPYRVAKQTPIRHVGPDERSAAERRDAATIAEGLGLFWQALIKTLGGLLLVGYLWLTNPWLATIAAIILGALIVFRGSGSRERPELYRWLEEERIPALVSELQPGMSYQLNTGLRESRVAETSMFEWPVTCFSNYLIEGAIVAARVEIGDVLLGERHWLLAIAETAKNVDGITHVIPKHRGDLWGGPKKLVLEKVEMDDPTFERHFDVFSSDPVAAHYALTSSMMSRILAVNHRWRGPNIRITFRGKIAAVGIETYLFPQDGDGAVDPTRLRAALELVGDLGLGSDV